jgi:hypothetical protein
MKWSSCFGGDWIDAAPITNASKRNTNRTLIDNLNDEISRLLWGHPERVTTHHASPIAEYRSPHRTVTKSPSMPKDIRRGE